MRNHRATLGLLSGAMLAMGLAALDQAIVTPALPAIARDLHGLEDLSWVVVAYLIFSTTTTLLYGKLSDVHGRTGVVTFAIAVFTIASALCALAHDMPQLIAARALQGAGAGGMLVMAQTMVGDLVAPRERGNYMAYITSVFAVATIAGPPLGGFLVEFDWRWCFWINLPLGVLALILCRRVASRLPSGHGRREIDYVGFGLLTGSVTAFLLTCGWVGRTYAWNAPPVVITFAVALALLAGFIAQERRTAEPIFPGRVFAKTIVRLADATAFMMMVLQISTVVLVPVLLQLLLQMNPGRSGVQLVPLMAGTVIGSFSAGRILHHTGRYAGIMPIGMALAAGGYALLATIGPGSAGWMTVVALLAAGAGVGVCFPILNVVVQQAAGPRDLGLATSSLQFARSLGGASGTAVFWSLLLWFVPHGLEHAPADELAQGFHHVFWIAAAFALAGAAITLGIRNVPLTGGAPAYARSGAAPQIPEQ